MLTVALLDTVDAAHAPTPVNDSERLLFRQIFGTLVRLDCHGETRPGLAEAWSLDSAGREWTFTLGKGARLPDGSPVTAPQVVSAWLARRDSVKELGIDSAVALDDRRLRVSLSSSPAGVPSLFAEPSLALMGTGWKIPPQYWSSGDPRDAIDRGVDLVVTRDPAVLAYVAARAEFRASPLPWSRTYALLQPAGAGPVSTLEVDSVRRSLAQDVAQTEARAAEPPFWWRGQCPYLDLSSFVASRPTSPRIVYRRDDKVARGLAERIVALTRGTVPLRTAALDPAEFAAALRDQRDWGYVLDLPRHALAPCHELAALPARAWIQPLIDTRASAIVRRGAPPLTVDWDGTVRPLVAEDSSADAR